jgi:peptidoglycan-associated lipoprotein
MVIASGLLLLTAAGCAKQPSAMDVSASALPGTERAGTDGTMQRSDSRPDPKDYVAVAEVPDVFFDFDRYAIRKDAMRVLDGNAQWLKSHPKALVMIEGHCDERGTGEYNFALGERRAKSTMDYLVSHGIAASRITVVSMGEERPMCAEHSEGCWAKNRRAHFLVKPE